MLKEPRRCIDSTPVSQEADKKEKPKMPGKNTTGLPTPEDYVLGRGAMYLSDIDTTTQLPTGWRFVGNVPNMTLTVTEENLDHYQSYESTKERDKRVTLQKEIDLGWGFDEINDENLASFLSGTMHEFTNPAVAGVTSFTWVAAGKIVPLVQYYELTDANGNPCYGVTAANIALATTNASPVTLVLNTDYTVDEKAGLIRFLNSAAIQAAVTATEGITLVLTADATAVNMDEVRALSIDQHYQAMLFNAVNPVNEGEMTCFKFHKVKISADGDMPLISDDWQVMPMSGSCDKSVTASSTSPYLTIRTPLGA